MDGVSVSSALGRIDLKLAASVGTEVVKVSGIGPHGVDRGISVVGTLGATAATNQSELSQKHNEICDVQTYHSRAGADGGIEVVSKVSVHVSTADVDSACIRSSNSTLQL